MSTVETVRTLSAPVKRVTLLEDRAQVARVGTLELPVGDRLELLDLGVAPAITGALFSTLQFQDFSEVACQADLPGRVRACAEKAASLWKEPSTRVSLHLTQYFAFSLSPAASASERMRTTSSRAWPSRRRVMTRAPLAAITGAGTKPTLPGMEFLVTMDWTMAWTVPVMLSGMRTRMRNGGLAGTSCSLFALNFLPAID